MRIEYIENGFLIKDGENCLVANIFTDKTEEEIKAIAERTLENCIAEKEKAQEKSLEECKEEKIKLSKLKLSEWFIQNPYLHTDGNYYSCTEEKQALLNSNLASYERAKTAGIEYDLKWNSTGAECKPWDYNDLLVLSLSIAGYVAPKVAKQQNIELDIKACKTIDEINAVVIDYDRNGDESETNS